jgi:P-type Ca2+ transporter type 2C
MAMERAQHDSAPAAVAWHDRSANEVVTASASDGVRGLAPEEARRRLLADGPNELRRGKTASPLTIFARQFGSLVIWVLIAAAAVSGVLGEMLDAGAILSIVFLNACFGFFQEYRAERAMTALARLTAPRARVVRDGEVRDVPAAEVVRGDVLALEAGDLVAADARLLEASSLCTGEAALTGESEPVDKRSEPCPADTPLAERRSMVFAGTSVTRGSGRALVVATGMATEVGRIASLLERATGEKTPLSRRLDRVAANLVFACFGIVALVFVLGVVRSIPLFDLFLSAVSLAVAAIPESLPAVVTIALALGVSRMARRNALVRRLPAVETLGSADVICTDKTGTITVGKMTARRLVVADVDFTVTGEGYASEGAIFLDGTAVTPPPGSPLHALLEAAAACVDAELADRDGGIIPVGDPTEAALLVVAAKAGIAKDAIEREMPRLATAPFDSDRKRMLVVRRDGDGALAFVKGAPEVVLGRCSSILTDRGTEPLGDLGRERMQEACALLAGQALRVLAFARRRFDRRPDGQEAESALTLLGFVGLQDPPRLEAREAVARCRRAGIRPVMITGDHPSTGRAIAREVGILGHGDEVVVGGELDRMSDDELRRRVRRVAVFARVTAEHKLRIVRAWKSEGAIVAMTGDGVNDAPALQEAAIGVAMGRSGTEVTKEAADMVITDDNFASIVAAVEEGRGIYDNIRKTLGYLLAGNAGELAVTLIAVLAGWPLPLLPIQLLWINLVTDGLPALALATDPIDPGVLDRPPRSHEAELIDRPFVMRLAMTAALTAAVTLAAFGWEIGAGARVDQARNAAFSVLVFAELLRAFGARSDDRPLWEIGLTSNARLLAVVAASFALQIMIHQQPHLAAIFHVERVELGRGLAWAGLGAVPLAVLEMIKVRKLRKFRKRARAGAG